MVIKIWIAWSKVKLIVNTMIGISDLYNNNIHYKYINNL
jgi:uncharacterized short protein YbdD (DUF466 family)